MMVRWEELTATQISRLDGSAYLVVWPIASVEQHGPHLPVGTDLIIVNCLVERVRERLARRLPILFGPTLPLGKSTEHLGFAGTVSLQVQTLLNTIEDIVASLASHGFKHLAFLNSHGGNTDLLKTLGPEMLRKYNVRLYYIDLYDRCLVKHMIEDSMPYLSRLDIHAGAVETSMLLYLRPDLVGPLPVVPTKITTLENLLLASANKTIECGWNAEDFGKLGIIGEPSKASKDIGERVVAYLVDFICSALKAICETMLSGVERQGKQHV